MAWIESHQEIGRHPKTKKLARRLGASIPATVGHLHLLWHWAMDFAEDGNLGEFESWELADAAMWEGDPDEFVDGLVAVGFIDQTEAGGELHDWHDYAGKLIQRRKEDAERKRLARQKSDRTGTSPDDPITSAGRPTDVRTPSDVTVPNRTVPNQNTGADAPAKPKPKRPRPVNGPAQKIIDAFCEAVGIDQPVSWDKAGGQAKMLHNAGVAPEDIPKAVEWCRSQKWLEDGFDLGTILSQADKWRPIVAKAGIRRIGPPSDDPRYYGTEGLKRWREEQREAQA